MIGDGAGISHGVKNVKFTLNNERMSNETSVDVWGLISEYSIKFSARIIGKYQYQWLYDCSWYSLFLRASFSVFITTKT